MKSRCDFCSGAFGLTRRKWVIYQFCKEACERSWRDKREQAITDFKLWLYASPVRGSPQR
jgi:hypothetical protein